MAGGNTWFFFLFWLDRPEVGFESEPEKSYRSSWMIGVLLSCICRTVSSCWSSVSLVSSSVILELASLTFRPAFGDDFALRRPCSPPFWHCRSDCHGSCYITQLSYSTQRMLHPLIWWTMFGHAIWKTFLTSLGGISTISAFAASMTCKVYASHISHPSWCVVVMNWGIPWMSQVLDSSPASNIFAAPCFASIHFF